MPDELLALDRLITRAKPITDSSVNAVWDQHAKSILRVNPRFHDGRFVSRRDLAQQHEYRARTHRVIETETSEGKFTVDVAVEVREYDIDRG